MPTSIKFYNAPTTYLIFCPAIINLHLAHPLCVSIPLHRYFCQPFSKVFLRPYLIPNHLRIRGQRTFFSAHGTSSYEEVAQRTSYVTEFFRLHSNESTRSQTRPIAPLSASQTWRERNQESLRSSSGAWTAVLAIFVIGSAVVFHTNHRRSEVYSHRDLRDRKEDLESRQNIVLAAIEDWSRMTGETLPGRPGNLTTEQVEKLREIWIATLQVFGVLKDQNGKELNGSGLVHSAITSQQTSSTSVPEKPKKKRVSLFSRKPKDSDTESTISTESTSPGLPADSDDKFGQTRQFHDTLAQQSPEALRAAFWSMVKHDHPDALLLRFLRARKWDVEKALIMMVATMSWRAKEMHVDDDIMRRGEEGSLLDAQSSNITTRKLGEDFLAQMRMGKSFLHGVDKLGRPMCLVRVRLHKQGEQSEESLERYTVFVIETARMILAPPVDTACIVFDMTGFSLANMDYSPVKFMIKCFEANYPESLGVVLVHKAPWVFQGIWKIIKGWLDPVVASKVHFTNNVEEMEEFVPRDHIPIDLGGEENWTYQYVEPVPGENDLMNDTATRDKLLTEREHIVKAYEEATLDWITHSNDAEATSITERRHQLAVTLKDDYWNLDPYVRARSMYDRIGMIQSGGKIEFYSPAPTVTTAKIPNGQLKVETSADDVD